MKTYINTSFKDIESRYDIKSFKAIYHINRGSSIQKWIFAFLIVLLLFLFLPWTQNIRSKGHITALKQEDRPQEVNAIVGGKIVHWYVKEGDFVNKGDTLLQLGEVKAEYLDPSLLERTKEQILAKNQSVAAYGGKANTASTQMFALKEGLALKLKSFDNKIGQQVLKIKSDSADLEASKIALTTYERQIDAAKTMLDKGVISQTEFEKRKVVFQDGAAKLVSNTNKLNQNRQELLNLKIEKNAITQEYIDKMAKAEGERFGSESFVAGSQAEVAKLENQLANYDARNKLYFVTAPQSGQITKAKKAGLGEVVKDSEMILEIVPSHKNFAVEMYVEPVDLQLLSTGQKVRFVFDGFPALVFSGWPNSSFGTFGGKITAIETSVSNNGMFRVLVAPDTKDRTWPDRLRLGGGANGIALLKDVPIYYELWRNINGFPPDFYQANPIPKETK